MTASAGSHDQANPDPANHDPAHPDHSGGHPQDSHDHRDCEDVIRLLYHFVDGELTVERRERIQFHLDECLPCFEAFDFEAELRLVISQRCRDKVPDPLRDRIAQALQAEADRPLAP